MAHTHKIGDLKVESRDSGRNEIRVSTPDEVLNNIIGDRWYMNWKQLPDVYIRLETDVNDIAMTLVVHNNGYMIISPIYITVPSYVSCYEMIAFASEMNANRTKRKEYEFEYKGAKLLLVYLAEGKLLYNISIIDAELRNTVIRMDAPIICHGDKDKLIADSFIDVLGDYIVSRDTIMTTQHLANLSKEIYFLIRQRLAPKILKRS